MEEETKIAEQPAEMTAKEAEALLQLKARKELGLLAAEFFQTPIWTKLLKPFFEGEKQRARVQRRLSLANHAMLAVWSSWEDSFLQIEEALQKTAKDAEIDLTEPLPKDESPSVEQ